MTYRDYLIWTASHLAHYLNEGIRVSLDMDSEEYSISHLEDKLDMVAMLAEYKSFNPERVDPRPVRPENEV